MSLPAGLSAVTLTGDYYHPDGSPLEGEFTFVPEVPEVAVAGLGIVLLGPSIGRLVNGQLLAADGVHPLQLVANDTPGSNPTGWTYRVYQTCTGVPTRQFSILLPAAASEVSLPEITEVDPARGTYVVVTGPKGDTGATGPQGPPGDAADAMTGSNNLSELTDPATARANLGLGTAAVHAVADFDAAGAAAAAASAAQTAAESYADAQLAAEVTRANGAYDPSGSSAAAQTAAEAHADAGDATTLAAANSYTDAHASAVIAQDVRVMKEVIVLPTAPSWEVVTTSAATGSTPLQCSIRAAVGDRIKADPSFMRSASCLYLDIALLDSTGAISTFAGSGTNVPLPEGNPIYYPQASSFPAATGSFMFTVQAGQVDGTGHVTVALVCRGTADGTQKVYADPSYPWYMLLVNLGPAPT